MDVVHERAHAPNAANANATETHTEAHPQAGKSHSATADTADTACTAAHAANAANAAAAHAPNTAERPGSMDRRQHGWL